jgi:iron complex transport system substrate-binding protein
VHASLEISGEGFSCHLTLLGVLLKKILFVLISSLALTFPAFATSYPLTIKDDLDRNVVIKAEPKRIIALLPSHTETVYALGAGSSMVGRDAYSDFPAQVLELPKVGDLYNPNIEAIVALKPDLVLNSEYGELTPKLEKAGITVWSGSAQTFDDVFETITVMGKILNREASATSLNAKMKADIREIETVIKAVKKVSVYYEIDPTPYTVGPSSYLGVLIAKAGGANIIPKDLGDFPKISPELVVKANPSCIIGTSQAEASKRPGWANLNAILNNRVFQLTPEQDNLVSRPGPRIAQGLRVLAKILHPGLFR